MLIMTASIDILTADSYSMQITVHKNLGQGVFPVPDLFDTGTFNRRKPGCS